MSSSHEVRVTIDGITHYIDRHLLGGRCSGWVPHSVRHEGDVHWYLARRLVPDVKTPVLVPIKIILDPTARQFSAPPPYQYGRPRAFLTRRPSRRARAMMDAMLWQEERRR